MTYLIEELLGSTFNKKSKRHSGIQLMLCTTAYKVILFSKAN
ncbi:acyltransferase [Staphylococcus argenteus]|nr:acyltransferase [Staphylococcus argenteus]KAA0802319.1 acyltransferase [Staphylococcus argenteus]MZG24619.1 acyltransferase [Staphylococcus argenteus]PSJ10791.1 acyltransferase [Staphylococcus argenteus]RRT90324.1 acyltransferase [Staphylococcus argenteus]